MIKERLQKFHNKLKIESILKSLIYGFGIGFTIAFVLAVIYYINKSHGIWMILIVWFTVSLVSSALFKYFVFRIDIKETATRLDKQLSLDERVITMVEYENQDQPILEKQRLNANHKLEEINIKQFKFMSIIKPTIALGIIALLAITMTTVSTIRANNTIIEPPIVEQTEEDKLIEKLIEDLRNIVDNADVSDQLKIELHEIIDQLEIDIKLETTTSRKIARIEETRKEIQDLIDSYINEKTTIIEELITHDSTEALGLAFQDGSEEVIAQTIDQIVTDFVAMSVTEMKAYIKQLADDIEQSVEDADIKDPSLEQELEDLIELLRQLIPKIDGDLPDELGDELQEILEQLGESLSSQDEEQAEEEIQDAIQDAIDELQDNPDRPAEEEPQDESNDEGNSNSTNTPVIIDGQTEFSQEIYDEIRNEMIDMLESGQITEEELIQLINNYLQNVEKEEVE